MTTRNTEVNWSEKDIMLIEEVKKIRIFHGFFKQGPQKLSWQEIAAKINLPVADCRQKWLHIKHNYAKLRNMIFMGRVTEAMVREHPKTKKYMDGSLDFLNPYIFPGPNWKSPTYANRFFASVLGKASKISTVAAEQLIQVGGNNFIEVIKNYTEETEKEPMSILPNIENYDNDSSSTTEESSMDFAVNQLVKKEMGIEEIAENNSEDVVSFMDLAMNQPIKEEIYTIEEIAGNNLESVEHNILPDIEKKHHDQNDVLVSDNVHTNVTSSSQNLLKGILMQKIKSEHEIHKPSENSNANVTVIPDPLARFLVKYNNEDDKIDLKQYFDDLAEILCLRLATEKRKHFLRHIDLIVSELLEGI